MSILHMDCILQYFDFSGRDVAHLASEPQPIPNYGNTIERMEEASAQGDLAAVKEAFSELQNSPAGVFCSKGPGNSLFLAVESKQASIVAYLLGQGMQVSPNIAKAATLNRDTEVLGLLLEHKWDINAQMEWASPPPLALAIEDDHLTAWFLSHGADPNAGCVLDYTPLSAAVQRAPFSVIKSLFDHGGSIHSGELLHYAVRRDLPDSLQVLTFILEKGPYINDVMYQHRPDSYAQQVAFGLGTPLHEAAEKGKLDAVRLLIENGAHPLIKDSLGRTPLERAERSRCQSVLTYLRPVTATAAPPPHQFTDGRRAYGWE